jgi:hypothetical protein
MVVVTWPALVVRVGFVPGGINIRNDCLQGGASVPLATRRTARLGTEPLVARRTHHGYWVEAQGGVAERCGRRSAGEQELMRGETRSLIGLKHIIGVAVFLCDLK